MNWEIVKSGFVAAWTAVAGVAGHKPADAPKPVPKPKPAKEVRVPAAKPGQGKVVRTHARTYLIERPSTMRFVGEEGRRPEGVITSGEVRILVLHSAKELSEDVKIYVRRG